MHKFDYSFLDNGLLPAGLFNLSADIYSLRTMSLSWKEDFNDIFTELVEIAKVQFVKMF